MSYSPDLPNRGGPENRRFVMNNRRFIVKTNQLAVKKRAD